MQLERKLYCHWDLVRFVPEQRLLGDNGYTLSVTDSDEYELMIFLGLIDNNQGYEVRVYKNNPKDKYTPHRYDNNVVRYEENEEYITFFFNNYEAARDFTYMIGYIHPEYKVRPARKIKC